MGYRTGLAGVALAGLIMSLQPASASCFEQIGCTNNGYMSSIALRQLSCDALWTVRNSIYADRGYCFKTARAQAVFGGRACYVTNESLIPFNAFERANIDAVVRTERAKGC